jgi:hypothetical protein
MISQPLSVLLAAGTLLTAALRAAVVFATAAALPAQWNEVGDAGDLPRTAQFPLSATSTFPSIVGSLASGTDVDMYLIQITDPSTFSASTVGGAGYDTQLWLFHLDGRGVAHNDDSVGTGSSLSGSFVPYAGLYYLAVSSSDRDAYAAGDQIWADTPSTTERRPDGARRGESIDSWDGVGGGSGNYTITLAGAERPRKQLLAPDNHHLAESPSVFLSTGSINWWRPAGGRFQVLFEASHFASMGAGAWIDKLLFRGEDGEANAGGQSWAGVTVRVARTSLTAATLGLDFAANLAAATSPLAVGTIATVTVRRSAGSFPNNYNIELDLYAAFGGFLYDPTQGNLLVDVTMPAAASVPANGAVMAMQDSTGSASVVRGAGINAAIGAATATAVSTTPIVMAIGIEGSGGAAPPITATNESYGSACGGSPSSFYQAFRNGQPFDVIAGLTLTPDNVAAPAYYIVSGGAGAFDGTQVNAVPNSTGDDACVAHNLGWTLNYPGGSTTSIAPCTNGYVWLDGASTLADFSPTIAEFLGSDATSRPRLAALWTDLQCGINTTSHPNSGLHVKTDTSGGLGNAVTYVTWNNVSVYNAIGGGNSVNQFQVAFFQATGAIEVRYGTVLSHAQTGFGHLMVGFTRGRIGSVPSVDPQSRDLSLEVPFTTSPEGAFGNIQQTVAATPIAGGSVYGGRAFPGQTLTFHVSGLAAGSSLLGVQLLDIAPSRPGFNIPGIHAPGCGQGTSLNPLLFQVTAPIPPAATSITGTAPLSIPPGFDGFELYAQYAVLDGLLFPGPLVTKMSNSLRIRVGQN